VASVEERVAYLEGRVEEHSHAMDEFRDAVRQIDRVREELGGRIDALDRKLDARFDTIDQKVSRTFLWVVGV